MTLIYVVIALAIGVLLNQIGETVLMIVPPSVKRCKYLADKNDELAEALMYIPFVAAFVAAYNIIILTGYNSLLYRGPKLF